LFEIGLQVAADQPGRIRVFDEARHARKRAGDADADSRLFAELFLDFQHQRRDRPDRPVIVSLGGRNTLTNQ